MYISLHFTNPQKLILNNRKKGFKKRDCTLLKDIVIKYNHCKQSHNIDTKQTNKQDPHLTGLT